VKLPELEESLLRAARESLSPTLMDRHRHEAALLARLDVPAASETGLRAPMRSETREIVGTGGLFAGSSPRLGAGRLELISAGLAVGVVVGGIVGFALGRSGHDAPEQGSLEGRAVSGPPEQRRERALGSVTPNARDEIAKAIADVPGENAAADSREPAERLAPEGPPGSRAAITTKQLRPARERERKRPESSLAVELSMLQRARRALGADNGRLALGIVQELEERFPRGVLMEERRATRVLSLCLLGRTDEARRFGREFLAQHGSSVYAERVRASCAVDGR
jgi:hypothetical protein